MRVIAVTTWFPTEKAPSRGSFVVRDLHAISRHAEVRLVHLVPPADDDGKRRLVHEGIDVLRIPMDPRRPDQVLSASRALTRALRGADLVHSMAFSSLLPLALRRPRVPWLHTEHWSALTTPSTLSPPARASMPVLTRLLATPDRVTAVCDFLARPIRAIRGERATAVVPCIVEPGHLVPRRERADGTLRIVSTGGLIERKDPVLAVEVLASLVEQGADAHLEWLGEGPLRSAAEERARELGVAERLTLPGNRSSAEVREALGRADLFFGPTRADNFFVSAAEAIVAGRPVVLGATGGQGEYVDPDVGVLVPRQNVTAYAEAILDLDRRTRELTARSIANTIGDRFSSATVGVRYHAQYVELLKSTASAPYLARPTRKKVDEERQVEIIIACHTPERPVARAVASILDGNAEHASVAVVCHNIPAEEIVRALRPEDQSRVRLLEHHDEQRSASGPFNAGITTSEAEFVSIMGSDDTLAPGAVASWLRLQERTGAELVLTRLALGKPSRGVPTPVARMFRSGLVDLAADRLSYRSAPLGLMRRAMLERTGVALVEGATVGGDVAMVTQLMATEPTAYDRCGPPYVIGEDAGDRVTYVVRPIAEQLGFVPPLLEANWFRSLPGRERAAIGTKILRIHVFGAVFYRPEEGIWTAAEREDLAGITAGILAASPGALHPLSLADRRLADACLDSEVPAQELIAAAEARRRHGRPATLIPRDLAWMLHREAPLRFMAASIAVKLLPR